MKSPLRSSLSLYKEILFVTLLCVLSILTFIPIVTYFYFTHDLSSVDALINRNNTGVILLDRNGIPFFKFYDAKVVEDIDPSDIPKHLLLAVIAAEDNEFYNHPGLSLKGILGALLADIRHQSLSYGGSTITQQLVKSSLLTSKKSFFRKYQEITLAQELERRFSKDQILAMYLNSVYFGSGAFGIGTAAKIYFNTPVKDLSLAQASLLAGIINSPSKLSPLDGDKEAAITRQHFVLDEMVQHHYITPLQKAQAVEETLNFNQNPSVLTYKAPHFALMVKEELLKKYSEEEIARSGFIVKTTLDLSWQDYAESVVSAQVEKLYINNASNGAAVVIDPKTGEVKALVGSKDWNNGEFGKFDVTTALRQPGSAFKPIVYLTAFEKNLITPATVLKDEPVTYQIKGSPPYRPLDFDKKFRGRVLVRRALANSLNIPSVEVIDKVGIQPVIEMAKRLGISSLQNPDDFGLSLVLGAGEVKLLELTGAYGVLANQGQYIFPALILEIENKKKGQLYKYEPQPKVVVDPKYTFLISSILSDDQTRTEVFGNALTISRPAAVKTGTSEKFRDSLAIGYTPSLVVGVWVGNNSGARMDNVAGSLGAAPIWRSLMEKFLENTPIENFDPPSGIISKMVCKNNGLLSKEASAGAIKEYFVEGSEPKAYCTHPTPNPSVTPSPSPNPINSPASPPSL